MCEGTLVSLTASIQIVSTYANVEVVMLSFGRRSRPFACASGGPTGTSGLAFIPFLRVLPIPRLATSFTLALTARRAATL